jgi:hypothetical protein
MHARQARDDIEVAVEAHHVSESHPQRRSRVQRVTTTDRGGLDEVEREIEGVCVDAMNDGGHERSVQNAGRSTSRITAATLRPDRSASSLTSP